MPFYVPWLTETIKKRGVRYLLHHYLGQFFEEKLTLEQLSIDIYEGRGSIKNLTLDVDGLNDELDFIPFRFLDGCLIGQISVEVPWSSLATEACRVELDGAKFVCRLKTQADGAKTHCMESTLLSRSLMTSSMQMAEEIITTDDGEEYETPESSTFKNHQEQFRDNQGSSSSKAKQKDANQMFEGLEMFAQLIDSVLRRTKLTARNTLFQIQAHGGDGESEDYSGDGAGSRRHNNLASSRSSVDEFSEPLGKSDTDNENEESGESSLSSSKDTVEFFIKFFRCEEMIDQTRADELDPQHGKLTSHDDSDDDHLRKPLSAMPETITKLLTLEDVEMRIGGVPVSNLIGKHTITIKFNGQKSEISIFSGSPLLAVISHEQLETFFKVFDSPSNTEASRLTNETDQKMMSSEDYARIENQLLESATFRSVNEVGCMNIGGVTGGVSGIPYYVSSQGGAGGSRRWVESVETSARASRTEDTIDYDYHLPGDQKGAASDRNSSMIGSKEGETAGLDNLEAFSCELKLPGIWLCILRDGERLPPLIKPYADSINSFQTINKYIDGHIRMPHIRFLALKVALNLTAKGINIFLGDLDISEHLTKDEQVLSSELRLLQNDLTNAPMNTSRYQASIVNKEITIEMLTKTRIVFDPTMIDRIVYDYKLVKLKNQTNEQMASKGRHKQPSNATPNKGKQKSNNSELNLTIRGERFAVELLCPIPDLSPQVSLRQTQLRPQSFLFDFKQINLTWQLGILNVSADELLAYVKTRPKQSDNEAIKFIESTGKNNDRIVLTLEPSPSRLNDGFPNDVEQALNESSLYDSIYVGQATESRIPTEAFQTKRKVVKASFQQTAKTDNNQAPRLSECDHERILTPGDRQHLLDYLYQTVMSTKLSLNLHLPVCELEFEDKEQLDLIYNRFGNDFVFWHPLALGGSAPATAGTSNASGTKGMSKTRSGGHKAKQRGQQQDTASDFKYSRFKQPYSAQRDNSSEGTDQSGSGDDEDEDSESSFQSSSFRRANGSASLSTAAENRYENEVTCKILVDELSVRFNHQSCAAALKQEITADNFLLGVVVDVDRKPNTLLSLVADNLELSTDSETVLEGNSFGNENSIFSLTAQIKRPTKAIKDIKLAIQLKNGLFNDFKTETYTRFWQSINVTDEPIMGYVAPKIVTELHIDILNTALSIIKEGARPALLSIDELYLTSMVMEQTSQVMIRLIADEVSLYLKRNRKGFELMKNYICLVDSGLIDLDVKFSEDGRLEFSVINNVITLRVCQDSLSALCKLFQVLIRNSSSNPGESAQQSDESRKKDFNMERVSSNSSSSSSKAVAGRGAAATFDQAKYANQPLDKNAVDRRREMNLLADAMNDFSLPNDEAASITKATTSRQNSFDCANRDDLGTTTTDRHTTAYGSDSYDEDQASKDSKSENDDDDDDDNNEVDDDKPPILEHRALSSPDEDEDEDNDGQAHQLPARDRDSNSCLLDESIPMLGDLFAQPLLLPGRDDNQEQRRQNASACNKSTENDHLRSCLDESANESTTPTTSLMRSSVDEFGGGEAGATGPNGKLLSDSGFFVIGDDDVGAGIIDKRQLEPVVRKLIDGPINIIESHFKMTKPRTIPEMLATSLERYVLEEMTLVVNLYGGRDFDDDDSTGESSNTRTNSTTAPSDATDHDTELLDSVSVESLSAASSKTCSLGGGGGISAAGGPVSQSSSSTLTSGSKKIGLSASNTSSLKRRSGARRKHLSEGSGTQTSGIGPSGSSNRHSLMEPRSVRFGEGAVNLWESLDLMSAPDFLGTSRSRLSQPSLNSDLKRAGGTWRQTDVCIQLTLSKVKLLYELADAASVLASSATGATEMAGISGGGVGGSAPAQPTNVTPISWRFMLFIQDIEVKDRVAASDINKMLYEYCTETMPKRSTQFLTIKNVATINPSDNCEECDLRVSLKPLRLNVDQDTLLFLIEFFTAFSKSFSKQQQQQSAVYANRKLPSNTLQNNCPDPATAAKRTPRTRLGSCGSDESVKLVDGNASRGADGGAYVRQQSQAGAELNDTSSLSTSGSSATSSSLSAKCNRAQAGKSNYVSRVGGGGCCVERDADVKTNTTTTTTVTRQCPSQLADPSEAASSLPTHCHSDIAAGSINQQPIYIKSFTFSPDVPIRLDYHAKHLDFEQGALAGILMGLAHLDHSELILKRVQANHGMRGLDRVLWFAMNSWTSDIKRNQLPSILRGVGPMHSVIQLFQGMRDLVWMPIDHYRKDKRLVRGLQRGASSFSSSTAMAAINLVNRFISIVQCTAQIAHDIVTPPVVAVGHHHHRHAGGRPKSHGGGQSVSGSLRHRHHHHHHHSRAGPSGVGGCGAGQTSCQASGSQSAGPNGLNQPRNFCEGVAVGFNIIKEGFNDTARNVTVGMQAEDMRSAVGELVRQIPSTLLNPIISATEGAQSVLVGIRNQIAPEARREDQEKWKRRVRGK